MQAYPVACPIANGQVLDATTGVLAALVIEETGGTNPVTVRLYDGTSTAGKLLMTLKALAATTPPPVVLGVPVTFKTGLFAEIVGTGVVKGVVHVA